MCNSDSPFKSKPISFRYKWYRVSFSLEKGSQADHSLQILICESPPLHQGPLSCSPSRHIQALKSGDSSSAILLVTPLLLSFTTNLMDLLNPHFLATPDLSPCFWSLHLEASTLFFWLPCSEVSSDRSPRSVTDPQDKIHPLAQRTVNAESFPQSPQLEQVSLPYVRWLNLGL